MYRIYEQEKKLFQIVYFKDPSSRLEIKKIMVKQIKTKNSHSMNLYPKASMMNTDIRTQCSSLLTKGIKVNSKRINK